MLGQLTIALLLASSLVAGYPNPQDDLSLEEVDNAAANNQRYGTDSGNLDAQALEEIFGIKNEPEDANLGVPKEIVVNNEFKNCSDYASSGYSCEPYYRCEDGIIIIDGAGLFNPRFGGLNDVELNPETSKCPGDLEMCCRHPDYQGLPIERPDEPEVKDPLIDPQTPPYNNGPVINPNSYIPQCGNRNNNGIGVRIQNSKANEGHTQFGEWPHMCAVLNHTFIGGEEHALYVCGGSLIAPNVILTAAHCVDGIDYSSVRVRCGEWDTQQTVEPIPHQDRDAIEVIIHPAFEKRNLKNDFALIILKNNFDLDIHIDTMCLPNQFEPSSYSWEDCIATGWGKDQFGADGRYQVIMKQVELDMVGHDICQDQLRQTILGKRFELDRSFSCAGGEVGKDTCTGDGGGPLVCYNPLTSRYEQAGIIAWGLECGKANVPGVYANVSEGLCFIDWATRCSLGQNIDMYGLVGCQRWAKRNYCELRDQSDILTSLIATTDDLATKGRLFRRNKEILSQIEPYRIAAQSCLTGPQDIDCNIQDYYFESQVDVSVFAKDSLDPRDDKKEIEESSQK